MRNRAQSASPRRPGALALIAILALLGPTLVAGPAPAATPCTSPPPVFPLAQLQAGMTGTGYTTIEGTTPTTFDVEILGVLPDYIWLDIDAIVVRITGPSSLLDQIGGVFYGMSGSPVYVNGLLVGAVSYGVSWDPTIFGLTPAQAMVDLFGQSGGQTAAMPERISFDDETRRAVARALDIVPTEVTSGLEQLPTYFGVSGLSGARLEQFQQMLDERNMGVRVAPSSSMDASLPVNPAPFSRGQPIGSVLSWGDFTIWAAGTVAVTCGDELVAFGHSLFWYPPGEISIGITGARVLAVGNGQGLWPGDMVPVLTEPRGSFIQDRFTGQVGMVGAEPPSTPITSSFSSPDTGLSRDGTTESLFQEDWWFPYTAWGHMVLNLGAVAQRLGDGTLDIAYKVQGTREDGTPFAVSNRGMFWSSWDATEGVYKLINALELLRFNRFEDISITSVDASGAITEDRLQGTIRSVRVSSPLQPTLRSRPTVNAAPGDLVTVEVTLKPIEGGNPVVATLTVKVPRWARGEEGVSLSGGKDRIWLRDRPRSFEDLLYALNGGEHENDLILSAFGGRRTLVQPLIIDGKSSFTIQIVR